MADELHKIFASCAAQFGTTAVSDLRQAGHAETAHQLQALIGEDSSTRAELDHSDDRTTHEAAAEALSTTLWSRLKLEAGFDHPAFREAFVLCKMRLAVMFYQKGDFQEAMREVDVAFIMGGPVCELQAMIPLIEPPANAALLPKKNGHNNGDRHGSIGKVEEDKPIFECPLFSLHDYHIPRVRADQLSVKEFRKNFFKADTPVIIGGAMTNWRAMGKWGDLQWLHDEHGQRTVPIELGRHADNNMQEKLMRISEFVDEHLFPSQQKGAASLDPPAYLAQHALLDQIPQLLEDVCTPDYCQAGCHEMTNVWWGTANTATTLHFDSYDNFLCQVVGHKYVRLYAQTQTAFLYQDHGQDKQAKNRLQGNLSQVDVGNVALDRFPDFEKAKFVDAILGPGDMLYIPNRWWHYVQSLSMSCSCNFWF